MHIGMLAWLVFIPWLRTFLGDQNRNHRGLQSYAAVSDVLSHNATQFLKKSYQSSKKIIISGKKYTIKQTSPQVSIETN